MHVAIMHDNDGTARVHKSDCADVAREMKTRNIISRYFIDTDSQTAAAVDAWDDFIGESMDESDALGFTTFLPCTKGLPVT